MKALLNNQRGAISTGESWALKLVSLLIAIILWISILGLKREELKKTVPLIPLVSPNMAVAGPIPAIQFTLSGPRVLLKEVEQRVHTIYENLSAHRGSVIPIAINGEMLGELPVGVQVESFTPTVVSIRLEQRRQKEVEVIPNILSELDQRVAKVEVTPKYVTVSGPRSLIEEMTSIETQPITLEGNTSPQHFRSSFQIDFSGGLQLVQEREVSIKVYLEKKDD